MSNRQLEKALQARDWNRAEAVLAAAKPFTVGAAGELVRTIIENGCLISKGRADRLATAKQIFIASALECAAASPQGYASLQKHLKHVVWIDEAYLAILVSLRQASIRAQPPAEQLWAAVERARVAVDTVSARLSANAYSERNGVLHSLSTKIRLSDGDGEHELVEADDAINSVAAVLFATIQMLASEHSWVHDKALRVPSMVTVNDELVYRSGSNTYFATAWLTLENAEEHLRHFGGKLQRHRYDDTDDLGSELFGLKFDLSVEYDLYEMIAADRLSKLSLQYAISTKILDSSPIQTYRTPSKLPPDEFISDNELIAFKILGDVCHIGLENDDERFGLLSARQWLRGYAVLQSWYVDSSPDSKPFQAVPLNHADLVADLRRAGLQPQEADEFARSATFGRGKRDLFDSPLLEDAQGTLHLLQFLVQSASLWKLVTSQLGRFNTSAQKGPAFERSVLQLFKDNGIPASRLTYEADGGDYECDVVALWDKTLFVIECKNHLLPSASANHRLAFWRTVTADIRQCKRIAEQITRRPDLIQATFGKGATYNSIHPVLLNAMPFCIPGGLEGVNVYDYSALNRFFTNPYLTFQSPTIVADGPPVMVEHRVEALWAGANPSPEDLLKQMSDPVQLAGNKGTWFVHRSLMPLSQSLVLDAPTLRRKDVTYADILRDRGFDREAIEVFKNAAESVLAALGEEEN